jgi:hypothetical protein
LACLFFDFEDQFPTNMSHICKGQLKTHSHALGFSIIYCSKQKNEANHTEFAPLRINWSTYMRITTTLAAAAALAVSGFAANAGGLSEEVMEAPIALVEPEPAGSSINSTWLVVGLLAALVAAAAANQ